MPTWTLPVPGDASAFINISVDAVELVAVEIAPGSPRFDGIGFRVLEVLEENSTHAERGCVFRIMLESFLA